MCVTSSCVGALSDRLSDATPTSTLLNNSYTVSQNERLLRGRARSSPTRPLCSDFAIPPSLILQLSKSPTPIFFTSYSLEALPQLNGSISYITSSIPLAGVSNSETDRSCYRADELPSDLLHGRSPLLMRPPSNR